LTILPPAPVIAPEIVSPTDAAGERVTVFPCKSIAPLKATALDTVTDEALATLPAPENVNAPLFATSPSTTVPPNDNPFVSVRAVVESLETVPPMTDNAPDPRAEA
jgi:hypothetical protein